MAKQPVVWVISYISSKQLPFLERDLNKSKVYRGVKTFIPMVNVLKKKHKGKELFDKVPFLFNYGFFRVPKYFIPNAHFLEKMKKDVGAIYAWVKDPCTSTEITYNKPTKYFLHNPTGVALATQKEIIKLKKSQSYKSIYSAADIDNLYEGKIIILKGYPFDGLEAEVKSINKKKKQVEVRLLLQTSIRTVKVSFDNVFYSIYHDSYMNTEMRESSLDELKEKYNSIDNILKNGWGK